MIEPFAAYDGTVLAWAAAAALMLVQLLVADVAGIRAGHVPGTPVEGGHDDLLFRATRALANTNESVAIFVLASLAAVATGADPGWTDGLALAWFAFRAGHAIAYWFDRRLARSVLFAGSLLALAGLAGLALAAAVH
jgi:uncharacterized MAPEG superfamily protein